MKIFLFLLALALPALPAAAQEKLRIGYFREWPLPALAGGNDGVLAAASGLTISWQAQADSAAMLAALGAGEIDVALSLGSVPLLVARAAEMDLAVIDISTTYGASQGCVAKPETGLSAEHPAALARRRIAVPVGTVTHYILLQQLDSFGVDAGEIEFLDLPPAQAEIAYNTGQADVACGWGEVYQRLRRNGITLASLPDADMADRFVFDAVVVPKALVAQSPETLQALLDGLDRVAQDPAPDVAAIAKQAAMPETAARATLDMLRFPDMETRLGAAWLGGGMATRLQAVADFLAEQATLDTPPAGLDTLVEASILSAVYDKRQAEAARRAAARAAALAENAETQATPETPPADQPADQ